MSDHAAIEDIIPADARLLVSQLGKGSERRARQWMLAITSFLAGQSKNTAKSYAQAIKLFFDQFNWQSPEDVTIAHGVAFKRRLLAEGLSNATVQARLAGMSSLFDYFCRPQDTAGEPLCKSNPFRYVPRRDIVVSPYARAKAVPWETFLRVFHGIPHDAHGLRDRAVLLFYAFTGRRRSEVAMLRIKDIDLMSKPRRYAVTVKGGRVQHYELPNVVYLALKAYWIASGRVADLAADDGVFTAVGSNAPLNDSSVAAILHSACDRAGVDWRRGNIRLHGLRHMSARQLDKAGVSLREIQAFLGHMHPNTTALYLEALSGTLPAHETTLSQIRKVADEFADLLGGTDD
ncbi:MAG: tyrosine-type recombinase/integrase [Phycisphaerae bacterium]|nr:tyrosine-type recombinase/integrase [Phycisphaerae bacterium]